MNTQTQKSIPLDRVQVGMYVVGVDRSWLWTPLLRHKGLIRSRHDIERLREAGIREVVIDPARGRDETTAEHSAPKTNGANGSSNGTGNGAVHGAGAAADAAKPAPPRIEAFQPSATPDLAEVAAIRDECILSVQRLFDGLLTGVPLDRPLLGRVVNRLMERVLVEDHRLLTLTFVQQIKRASRTLYAHCVDTCVLSMVVGRACGLRHGELEDLGHGAMLHDIGHLRLPPSLHCKQGSYTSHQREQVQPHPVDGVALCSATNDLPQPWMRIIGEHHECLDGSGSPAGLRGPQISMLSQIVGVVDRYDAMATGRDGADQTAPDQVLRQLYREALIGRYHHDVVSRLIQTVGVYPVGSLCELQDGERAIVIAVKPENRLNPVVRIITDMHGNLLSTPATVDLAGDSAAKRRKSIRRLLNPRTANIDVAAYL